MRKFRKKGKLAVCNKIDIMFSRKCDDCQYEKFQKEGKIHNKQHSEIEEIREIYAPLEIFVKEMRFRGILKY